MREVNQINIKNRTYYFYNDVIDLENFEARLIKKVTKRMTFITSVMGLFKKLLIVTILTV